MRVVMDVMLIAIRGSLFFFVDFSVSPSLPFCIACLSIVIALFLSSMLSFAPYFITSDMSIFGVTVGCVVTECECDTILDACAGRAAVVTEACIFWVVEEVIVPVDIGVGF